MTYKCPLKKVVHDFFEGILNPLNNIQKKNKKHSHVKFHVGNVDTISPAPKQISKLPSKFTLGPPIVISLGTQVSSGLAGFIRMKF